MSKRLQAIAALIGFWLLIPFPFWMLGNGFAGRLVFWPSFEPDVAAISSLFVAAFYGPVILIAVMSIAPLLRKNRRSGK